MGIVGMVAAGDSGWQCDVVVVVVVVGGGLMVGAGWLRSRMLGRRREGWRRSGWRRRMGRRSRSRRRHCYSSVLWVSSTCAVHSADSLEPVEADRRSTQACPGSTRGLLLRNREKRKTEKNRL